MMSERKIALRDLWALCWRSRQKIAIGTLLAALLAALLALHTPVRYQAEGSFKDSGKLRQAMREAFTSLAWIGGGASQESVTASIMKARSTLEIVVKCLGMQGTILPYEKRWPLLGELTNEFKTMGDNIKIEYGLWRDKELPSLPDLSPLLRIEAIEYCGEVPQHFFIVFEGEQTYRVIDHGYHVGTGQLGAHFFGPGYQFTLVTENKQSLHQRQFLLLLQPLAAAAEAAAKSLTVESDRMGKNILWLRYSDRDRFRAANFVNSLMQVFRELNIQEDRTVVEEQINYLHRRQKQIAQNFQKALERHASRCAIQLQGSGFPDVEKQINFFVANQQDYYNKQFAIELERSRLQKYLKEGFVYYDRYATEGDPIVINHLLDEMRHLKKEADIIELALSKTAQGTGDMQAGLSQQLIELHQVRQMQYGIETLLSSLQHADSPDHSAIAVPTLLLEHPRYMVEIWMKRLELLQQNYFSALGEDKAAAAHTWRLFIDSFVSYLSNLSRLLQVYVSDAEEHLIRYQDHSLEFQGFDLNAARELYSSYSKRLSEIEAKQLHGSFIYEQLQEPEFEVSSLSTALEDPVSQELFGKASHLVLELRDQSNRSQKEIVRLKEELLLHKQFLAVHLKQMLQLDRLGQKSLVQKIYSLQHLLRDLIHMRLTVLQRHLEEYVLSRLSNLQQEHEVIQQRQEALRSQMRHLPLQLIEKKIIDHQIAIEKTIIEEMAKLVESKNINGHLDVLQSGPLDPALPPLHPRSSKIIFLTTLGALFGAFITSAAVVMQQLRYGLPATARTLRLHGQHVAGFWPPIAHPTTLDKLSTAAIELLRDIANELCPLTDKEKKQLLLLENKRVEYGAFFAALLAKRGEKVLLIELNFAKEKREKHGLESPLEGHCDGFSSISKRPEGYDVAMFQTQSGLALEELLAPSSTAWLHEQQSKYDRILCAVHTSPDSSLARALAPLFPRSAIAISDISLEALQFWFPTPKDMDEGRKTTFVFAQS